MTADKPRRLGRGLEALISSTPTAAPPADRSSLQRLPIADIRPNPYQPRKDFRPDELAELEVSLQANGLLQPVVVRRAASGGGYELIAGERRLRAATGLGWKEIPVVLRDVDDRTLLTLALVENLQRADLNPVEEAEGYHRLMSDFGLTQQQIADLIGKDRSTVANMLRVLQLPAAARSLLQGGQITIGHARALLQIRNERSILDLASEIVATGLTVRDVEKRAREVAPRSSRPHERGVAQGTQSAETQRVENELRRHFQTDVKVTLSAAERGAITISFFSSDDLERLLDLLLGTRRDRT